MCIYEKYWNRFRVLNRQRIEINWGSLGGWGWGEAKIPPYLFRGSFITRWRGGVGGAGQVARNPPRNVSKKGSTALLVLAYQLFCLWGDFTEKTPFLLGNAQISPPPPFSAGSLGNFFTPLHENWAIFGHPQCGQFLYNFQLFITLTVRPVKSLKESEH